MGIVFLTDREAATRAGARGALPQDRSVDPRRLMHCSRCAIARREMKSAER
jgi:hypothetical protein